MQHYVLLYCGEKTKPFTERINQVDETKNKYKNIYWTRLMGKGTWHRVWGSDFDQQYTRGGQTEWLLTNCPLIFTQESYLHTHTYTE